MKDLIMLAKRSYAIWNILLATEEEARQLAGSIIMAKVVRLQTEYIATQKITVTVYGVPADITEDLLGSFFAKYGQVGDVSPIINKVGIATTNFVLQVTMSPKNFMDIPDILICRDKRKLLVM